MHKPTLAIFSLVVLAGGVSAVAQDSAATGHSSLKAAVTDAKSQCTPDIQKFCSDVTPGGGRIAACLRSKEDQLSPTCNSARMNLSSMISGKMDKAEIAFRKNCGSDVQKFCSEVPSGGGKILDCLGQHEGALSNSCKNLQTKIDKKVDAYLG